MNQARIIDVNRYYRTGGIDWHKLKGNCDAVVISAGVGMSGSVLLQEQVQGAVDHDLPYFTYHIPNPIYNIQGQVEFYLSLYGVRDAPTCLDIEPPNSIDRCVTAAEALAYSRAILKLTNDNPIIYSNPQYLNLIGKPAWLENFWLWIAAWPYRIGWPLNLQYNDFDTFLARYACTFPSYVRNTPLQDNTILWQFSCKGDAQRLAANKYTNDPKFKLGMKSCDLNVSTIEKEQFLKLLGVQNGSPEPPPEPAGIWYLINVADRNIRSTPNSLTGTVLLTLHLNDQVLVGNIVAGVPGQWGVTVAYKRGGVITPCVGNYIYMNNLIEV